MNKKNKQLLDLIKYKGNCFYMHCYKCQFNIEFYSGEHKDICRLATSDEYRYKRAIELYIKKNPVSYKEDLLEVII